MEPTPRQCIYCEYFVSFNRGNICNAFHSPSKKASELTECPDYLQKDYEAEARRYAEVESRVQLIEPAKKDTNGQCLYCEFFVTFTEGNICNAFHSPSRRVDEWIYCQDFRQKDYMAERERQAAVNARVYLAEPVLPELVLKQKLSCRQRVIRWIWDLWFSALSATLGR